MSPSTAPRPRPPSEYRNTSGTHRLVISAPVRNIAVENVIAIVFAVTTQPRACRRIAPRRIRSTSDTGIRTMTPSGISRSARSRGIAPLDDGEDDGSDRQDEGGDAEREAPARCPCRALVSEGERVDLLSHVLRELSGRAGVVLQLGESRVDAASAIAGVARSHSSEQRISRRED